MRRFDLVLFDWDGTISVTDELIVRSVWDLSDLYGLADRPSREKIVSVSHLPLKELLYSCIDPGDVLPSQVCEAYVRYACKNLVDGLAPLCDGAREAFAALRRAGIRTGVFSNKDRKQLGFFSEYTGIAGLSDVVISTDDVKTPKPAPEGLLLAMKKTGVRYADRVLYVGDNTIDYDLAANSGARSAIVLYARRELETYVKPDYLISSLAELTDICI
ncbi:MAG: HAD family hydrolase [Clostridia bacterium]|nr:HAD family hydrolase [Clostridia bacterium]